MDFEPPMLQTVTEPSGGFLIGYRQRRYRTLQPRQKSTVAIDAPSSQDLGEIGRERNRKRYR